MFVIHTKNQPPGHLPFSGYANIYGNFFYFSYVAISSSKWENNKRRKKYN